MAYKSIRFYNFRNLADREIELNGKIFYLIGENGAGKSSFLEALYLLSYGSSFREKNLEHCLRENSSPLVISGKLEQRGQPYKIQLHYSRESSKKAPGQKQISLDGKRLQDRKELLQLAPSIIFSSSDITYIKGSPRDKRQFIDQTISLIDPTYIDLVRNYTRNLLQRNWILKDRQPNLLPTYTLQMAEMGLEIQRRRTLNIARLSEIFSKLFHHVSNFDTPVTIDYQPSWPHFLVELNADKALQHCLEYIEQRQQRDILSGSSQNGPHRDQIQFNFSKGDLENKTIDNSTAEFAKDFTKWASTGQLRLAALALKSAQANYLQQNADSPGVLLLDDVLLEMDSTRRKLFLASLPPHRQAFFTLLPNEDYQSYPFSQYQVFQIQKGQVSSFVT